MTPSAIDSISGTGPPSRLERLKKIFALEKYFERFFLLNCTYVKFGTFSNFSCFKKLPHPLPITIKFQSGSFFIIPGSNSAPLRGPNFEAKIIVFSSLISLLSSTQSLSIAQFAITIFSFLRPFKAKFSASCLQ